MDNYKLVDITSMSMSEVETELNNQAKLLYYFHDVVTIGSNIFAIFTPKSLSR